MKLLIILIIILILFFIPLTNCILTNLFKVFRYGIKDIFVYIKHKLYNRCEDGFLDFYIGDFGSGKTLSAVQRVIRDYDRYNGKITFIDGKFQKVKINILSNVNVARPHTLLTSMQQIVDWCAYQPSHRNEWCICLIDEASAVMNSRSFSSNLNPITINSLVTCRHFNLGILLCSQKQKLCDALLRDVGQHTIKCNKYWRLLRHRIYNTCDIEMASDLNKVKPIRTQWRFTDDKYYNVYDTTATVGDLMKKVEKGDMRSTAEITQSLASTYSPVAAPDQKRKHRLFRKK